MDTAKVVLRGKYMALNTCIRKEKKRFKINDISLYHKKLEKEEKIEIK